MAARVFVNKQGQKRARGYLEDADAGAAHSPGPAPPPRTADDPLPSERRPPAVALRPDEWGWAAWRPVPPAPEPPDPFDRTRAARAMRRARAVEGSWTWTWNEPPFTGALASEEATAWLVLVSPVGRVSPSTAAAAMERFERHALTPDEAFALACASMLPVGLAMAALAALMPAPRIAEWLLADEFRIQDGTWRSHAEPRADVALGVRAHLLPRLSTPDRDRFVDAVRDRVERAHWPSTSGHALYQVPPLAFFLAAQVGLHEPLQTLVDSWPDDAYRGEDWADHHHRPQAVVFGLGSREAVREAFERIDLRFSSAWHVAAWLAHTETGGLDLAADRIARITNRPDAEAALRVLARVHDASATRAMLDLVHDSRAPAVAREWLADHRLEASIGAARMLAGPAGRARDRALEYLRARRRAGDDVGTALAHLEPSPSERLRELVLEREEPAGRELAEEELPAALRSALDAVPPTKLPDFIDVSSLPRLPLGKDGCLGAARLRSVLHAAAGMKPAGRSPDALLTLAKHVDRRALGDFAWALFEQWLADGAPPQHKWAFLALGALGNDAVAVRLAPRIRAWPGESQHQRAVMGLDVLGAIGTDTALMLLSGIAHKVKFKALQARAREAMDRIAIAKGMTKAELEDRIVPDCGLDEHGSRVFDFGARSFSFVLGPGMKPMVRDEVGKVRTLPKPGTRDDPALAARAVKEWKLLRKQVGDVAKVQGARLEQAMITQRRWSVPDFERFLVRHPLQRHLVQGLVWGLWEEDARARTFRVTDELDYAGEQDEPLGLPADGAVGLVHPLQLDEGARAEWGDLLADYEIVPPFAQLGRPVQDIAPEDREAESVTRFSHRKVAAATLVRTLDGLGWERGEPMDGGVFTLHAKPFPALDVTAVIEYEGVPVGYMLDSEDQAVERCYVIPRALRSARELGYGLSDLWDAPPDRLRWKEVDPIVRSEVLADVAAVVEKAR